jgi:hypothetical protein
MMHTSQALYDAMRSHLSTIDSQIDAIRRDFENSGPIHHTKQESDIYRLKHMDGTYVLSELLAAKAQMLSGMAALKAADIASKAPRR